MTETGDEPLDRLEVLLALQSLLDFAKLSADEIAADALVSAINEAKSVVDASIQELDP